MRLNVYSPGKEKDNDIYLKLEQNTTNGRVAVVACYKDGIPIAAGNLVVFERDGTISLCTGVNWRHRF